MATPKEILQHLWDEHRPEFEGWHGYSTESDGSGVTLYFRPETESGPLIRALASEGISRVTTRFVPQFRQLAGGPFANSANPLQVGTRVSAKGSGPKCQTQCPGTIGAFLQLTPTRSGDRVWLLGSHHVLVPRGTCLITSAPGIASAQIFDAGGVQISTNVRFATKTDGSFLDAAIVPVMAGSNGYDPSLGITDPTPISPAVLQRGISVVTKQGIVPPRITSGTFFDRIDRLAVTEHCTGTTIDYVDELLIESMPGQSFASDSDSGSLVVFKGQPLGLVCAMSDAAKPGQIATSPLGLVTAIDVVIQQLASLVDDRPSGRALVMLPLQLIAPQPVQPVASGLGIS